MRRLFWLGLGIAAGVVIARQVAKAVEAYSPSSLAGEARNSAAGILGTVRDFIADVREGMAEREAEIHAAFEQGISLAELDERQHDEYEKGAGSRP